MVTAGWVAATLAVTLAVYLHWHVHHVQVWEATCVSSMRGPHFERRLLLIVSARYEVGGAPAFAAWRLLKCHNPSRSLRGAPMIRGPLVKHPPVQHQGSVKVAASTPVRISYMGIRCSRLRHGATCNHLCTLRLVSGIQILRIGCA